MMRRNIHIIIPVLIGFLLSFPVVGQEEDIHMLDVSEDDLGNVSDDFQENFFEALKQKGIENYEKAITALLKCQKLAPENEVVYFELGKNYRFLKNYDAAIQNFQTSNRLKPDQEWVMVELMETYFENNDFEAAILIARKLIPFNSKYQNNLADLYFKSQKYDELITLLDELDAQLGVNEFRLSLRQQIYTLTDNTPAQIRVLKDAIKTAPDNEANYLNLVFVYSAQGMTQQAFEMAEEMRKKFPSSKVVHLALYKFYLDSQNTSSAVESMKMVLNAEEIDPESKFKVLNDFLGFVNENPKYENELKEVITLFAESENSPSVYQKLGEYYLLKGQKERALTFFELGIARSLDNFDLLQHLLLLQIDLGKYDEAIRISGDAIDLFPGQPLLYLIKGIALNKQMEFKGAEQILTFGLDYVIDNKKLEVDFLKQLATALTGLGNTAKAKEFQDKANEIIKTLN